MRRYLNGEAWDLTDVHLARADPVMADLIRRYGPVDDQIDGVVDDLYGALIFAIVNQQISGRAAHAIFARLTARFGGRTPTPDELLGSDLETLRTAVGLSHAKARALHSLAVRANSGELDLARLPQMPDDEAIDALTAVTGIGIWTASVFLMFRLHRPDVLAQGDLGIRRAVQVLYGLPEAPDPNTLTHLANAWRPYRSRACIYLWRSVADGPTRTAKGDHSTPR